MKPFAAIALLAAFLAGPSPCPLGAVTSQPDNLKSAGTKEAAPALPDAASATKAAAAIAENGLALGEPKLFDQAAGLAVDQADPKAKDPKVVAYVGPSWIIPASRPDHAAAPACILDRGTGRLVARANDILPMPRPGVVYVDDWQLAAGSLSPSDSVAHVPGGGLGLQLDLGAGNSATMTISPGNGAAWAAHGTPIKLAGRPGKMTVQPMGNNIQLIASDDDGSLMARLIAPKTSTDIEQKFKDILLALGDRPASTRIWPADSRPRITGVAGWATPENASEGAAICAPQVQADAGGAPGVVIRGQAGVVIQGRVIGGGAAAPVGQTYLAARVLHPYDLPPAEVVAGLGKGKIISARPAELGDWVGTEKVVEFTGPVFWNFGQQQMMMFQPAGGPAAQTANYRVRLLDLHNDLRRLLIRCQAPADQFDKFAPDFDRLLPAMKIPDPPADPVVVPLHPTTYKDPKK